MAALIQSRFENSLPVSVLAGVDDATWSRFVNACAFQGISEITRVGVGAFAFHPRRLGELGLMSEVRRGPGGYWTGTLVDPRFLQRFSIQMQAFERSMKDFDARLDSGELTGPEDVTRSGCLAILHRGGVGALRVWPQNAFHSTRALCDRTNHLF